MKNMFYIKTIEGLLQPNCKYAYEIPQKHRHQPQHSSFSIPYKRITSILS